MMTQKMTKPFWNTAGVACMLIALTSCSGESAVENESHRTHSRALVSEFGKTLQTELQTAMQTGGPVAAINVCKTRAPAIAAELSLQSGATVTRTSTRVRNPDNEPAPWQRDALASFAPMLGDGQEPGEYHNVTESGEVHFMKAIYVKPLCLACHGESVGADIANALQESYPQDRATGYRAGELRGAFSVVWPPG